MTLTMDNSFSNDECLLINSRLFTDDQVKYIKNMRNQYEAKIRRKEKQAFFMYIEAEKKILHKIQLHIKKCDKLTKQIILRIIKIHNIALANFKEELRFWISYIKFCTEIGNVELVTKSFPLLLEVHKNEEKVWHLVAKWELNKFDNKDKALNYLYKGLHHNPTAVNLYTHILKLVLSKCNSVNELDKQEINAEKEAIELFEKSTKTKLDIDLYTEFLKISTEYHYTKKLQPLICIYLTTNFSSSEDIWNLLAQRELEGHHVFEHKYEFVKDKESRIKNCIKQYQAAIKNLPTEKMWERYLNTLVDLRERYDSNTLIKESFISACTEAHKNCFMTEKHYILWIECLNNSPEVAEILKFATKNKPHCIQLWDARIRYHFNKKEEKIIDSVFDEAVQTLGDKSASIWRRKIQYYQLNGDSHKKIESIFREGLSFSIIISSALQPQFLEWTALFRSRDVAHNLYTELSIQQPVCIDLHKKMAELEAMTSNPKSEIFHSIQSILKEHPEEFREWQEYVSQEIHYGSSWRSQIYKKYLSSG